MNKNDSRPERAISLIITIAVIEIAVGVTSPNPAIDLLRIGLPLIVVSEIARWFIRTYMK
jgi:hypothetical protein